SFYFFSRLRLFAAFHHPPFQEWNRQGDVGLVHEHFEYLVVETLVTQALEFARQFSTNFVPEISFVLYFYVRKHLCIELLTHVHWYQQTYLSDGEPVVLLSRFLTRFQWVFQESFQLFFSAYISRNE